MYKVVHQLMDVLVRYIPIPATVLCQDMRQTSLCPLSKDRWTLFSERVAAKGELLNQVFQMVNFTDTVTSWLTVMKYSFHI